VFTQDDNAADLRGTLSRKGGNRCAVISGLRVPREAATCVVLHGACLSGRQWRESACGKLCTFIPDCKLNYVNILKHHWKLSNPGGALPAPRRDPDCIKYGQSEPHESPGLVLPT